MRRAIVIYLEDKRNLMIQFGCLYTSLKYIDSKDTDLVVFGTKEALKKVPNDCIKIENEPISYLMQWQNYHYINSIGCLIDENSDFLEDYDLLLRSDADTFLTPAWNSFYPNIYTVGRGGYVNDENTRSNLKRIAKILGLNHKGIHNIGSTHYGNSKLVRKVCRLTVSTTLYIINNEFEDGYGNWPGWYKGVSSLYGTEIAANHLIKNFNIDHLKLDFYSTSGDSILNHPHIHCWHTHDMFSKFSFEAGKYDHILKDSLDINKVKDYCLYMALKCKNDMPWLY
jgi:hypothetical protein